MAFFFLDKPHANDPSSALLLQLAYWPLLTRSAIPTLWYVFSNDTGACPCDRSGDRVWAHDTVGLRKECVLSRTGRMVSAPCALPQPPTGSVSPAVGTDGRPPRKCRRSWPSQSCPRCRMARAISETDAAVGSAGTDPPSRYFVTPLSPLPQLHPTYHFTTYQTLT